MYRAGTVLLDVRPEVNSGGPEFLRYAGESSLCSDSGVSLLGDRSQQLGRMGGDYGALLGIYDYDR